MTLERSLTILTAIMMGVLVALATSIIYDITGFLSTAYILRVENKEPVEVHIRGQKYYTEDDVLIYPGDNYYTLEPKD
jgi:hypothetical protein